MEGASLNKPATLLKITLLHRCFSPFKNCAKVPNRAKHHLRRYENSKQGKQKIFIKPQLVFPFHKHQLKNECVDCMPCKRSTHEPVK